METVSVTYVNQFEDFLKNKYANQLQKLAEFYPEKRSLNVDYGDLDAYDITLADELIEKPYVIMKAAQDAIAAMDIMTAEGKRVEPHVRFFNLPDEHKISVRDITSKYINRFLMAEGVVTKLTEVKPKLINAAFECRHCGRVYNLPQQDPAGRLNEPLICSCERKNFQLLPDQSEFIDTQRAEMQEPIEMLRGGEQAKKIALLLEQDLTNKIVPGDKITVSGVLRLQNPRHRGSIYDKFIDSNHVLKLEREFEELEFTEEDEEKIKALSKDPEIYKKIVGSIAPSIYGHNEIKEAIALQLLGGTTNKKKPDGMLIRPDMHILLIGDPGTAKTQLLRYVKDLAPKGIYVSGKASTGAGLTATAERDELGDGGWTLKAGALVLAAGGAAMIDEFDKMDDNDRSAMHEAMESQQISVAKAGILATFKANTSILAAANPKFGRFDPYEIPADQFDIPPTLMSRFDLIFPVRDVLDETRDREMADHILTSHYTAGVRTTVGYDEEMIKEAEKPILPLIESGLLRNYIAYARKNMRPILTKEAIDKIRDFYIDLRRIGEKQGSIAITARYLEAIVRLAEASAKGRLSNSVDIDDASRAIRLLKFCLKEVGIDPETGRYDIDIITIGTSKTKMDKLRSVLRIIKGLSAEVDEVRHDMILDKVKEQGMRAGELEEALQTLRKNGDIYNPRHGVYKPAEDK